MSKRSAPLPDDVDRAAREACCAIRDELAELKSLPAAAFQKGQRYFNRYVAFDNVYRRAMEAKKIVRGFNNDSASFVRRWLDRLKWEAVHAQNEKAPAFTGTVSDLPSSPANANADPSGGLPSIFVRRALLVNALVAVADAAERVALLRSNWLRRVGANPRYYASRLYRDACGTHNAATTAINAAGGPGFSEELDAAIAEYNSLGDVLRRLKPEICEDRGGVVVAFADRSDVTQ